VFVRDDINTDPEPARMSVCHGNGCLNLRYVDPDAGSMAGVALQAVPSLGAQCEAERVRLRRAIAHDGAFRRRDDRHIEDKGGTFNGGEGQMDCIDESINTTLYLTMFQKYGLMRDHRVVDDRATRGWFIGGWPHTTAVVPGRAQGGFGQSIPGFSTTASHLSFCHWKRWEVRNWAQ
jgi:hypothetical protein